MAMIREVWCYNLHKELMFLNHLLIRFPIVTIDTEFPGFIKNTPRGASEQEFYNDLQFNVNHTKLIQLGLTISNDIETGSITWQFNFGDFNEEVDSQDPCSITFLKNKAGFDFEKLKRDGIMSEDFTSAFLPIYRKGRISKWVTFHGLYDIGYLLKLLKIRTLPKSMEVFANTARHFLGNVIDIKYIARYCDGLQKGEIGLEKMAELLDVERIGTGHQAGSDSLLTASLYAKMKQKFEICSEEYEGFLYGLSDRIHMKKCVVKIIDPSKTHNFSVNYCSKWQFFYGNVGHVRGGFLL